MCLSEQSTLQLTAHMEQTITLSIRGEHTHSAVPLKEQLESGVEMFLLHLVQ